MNKPTILFGMEKKSNALDDAPSRTLNLDGETLKESLKIFITQGALATGISAALLGGAGLVIRGKIPAFGKMLTGAAATGVKFLNPVYTYKTVKKIPEASDLFAAQMRISNKLIDSKLPATKSSVDIEGAARGSGMGYDDVESAKKIRAYKERHGETPADTIENSIGIVSGFTGLGGAGVSALFPIFDNSKGGSKANRSLLAKVKNTIMGVGDEWS